VDEQPSTEFKPPYLAFQTFWSFLDELASKPLPPQIDRSLLSSKSGTDQTGLLNLLKGVGFISPDLSVEPALGQFVDADEEGRKKILANLLAEYFPKQIEVSESNGTEKQLLDSFEEAFGYTGDTRRKATTFFLHAARTAGLHLSPHFPKTRSGSGSPTVTTRRRIKRKPEATPPTEQQTPATETSGSARTKTVKLRSGSGFVTLIYDADFFEVSDSDEKFVLGLISQLREYERQAPKELPAGESAAATDPFELDEGEDEPES
jgi:hypothetical protein